MSPNRCEHLLRGRAIDAEQVQGTLGPYSPRRLLNQFAGKSSTCGRLSLPLLRRWKKECLLALPRNAACEADAVQRSKYAEAERFKRLAAVYLDRAKRPRDESATKASRLTSAT
jgi:hypothetical protein